MGREGEAGRAPGAWKGGFFCATERTLALNTARLLRTQDTAPLPGRTPETGRTRQRSCSAQPRSERFDIYRDLLKSPATRDRAAAYSPRVAPSSLIHFAAAARPSLGALELLDHHAHRRLALHRLGVQRRDGAELRLQPRALRLLRRHLRLRRLGARRRRLRRRERGVELLLARLLAPRRRRRGGGVGGGLRLVELDLQPLDLGVGLRARLRRGRGGDGASVSEGCRRAPNMGPMAPEYLAPAAASRSPRPSR